MAKQQSKAKLRTASDIINRFNWSADETNGGAADHIFIGYNDRVRGPLEMPLQDWVPVKSGGDLPEHRILYFRRQKGDGGAEPESVASPAASSLRHQPEDIIWDRAGRVDKVFGSGKANGLICGETLAIAKQAIANTLLLEEERQERRKLRAKEKARKVNVRRQNTFHSKNSPHCGTHETENDTGDFRKDDEARTRQRFSWKRTPWYRFYSDQWNAGVIDDVPSSFTESTSDQTLKLLTWNVMFDLFDEEENEQTSEVRWTQIAFSILRSGADVICLQEATPKLVEVLCQLKGIRDNFGVSAAPSDVSSVEPCGNLILFRLHTVRAVSPVLICVDGGRNRAVAMELERIDPAILGGIVNKPQLPDIYSSSVLVANLHLPANRPMDTVEKGSASRERARRRELSAILAQLARMEDSSLYRQRELGANVIACQSIIAGDFNAEDSELSDGCFSGVTSIGTGYFQDSWLCVGKDRLQGSTANGYTFDPATNERADRSRRLVSGQACGRRIDRIYCKTAWWDSVGVQHSTCRSTENAELITGVDVQQSQLPPSDHYGVLATLCAPTLQNRSEMTELSLARSFDAWAASAMPCPDTIVVLMLEDAQAHDGGKALLANIRSSNGYGEASSLPAPHLTLLHGFAELGRTGGSLDMAVEAVAAAVADSEASGSEEIVHLAKDSLGVFVHRQSATVFAAPARNQHPWIHRLYHCLRKRFRLCDEQEMRGDERGWHPHVALGSFGSSTGARCAIQSWRNDRDVWGNGVTVAVRSIALLERGDDGKFHPVASVLLRCRGEIEGDDSPRTMSPVMEATSCKGLPKGKDMKPFTLRSFLADAGKAASEEFNELSRPSLHLLDLACREAAAKLECSCSLETIGSAKFHAALPKLSDVDAVAVVQSKLSKNEKMQENALSDTFFASVMSFASQHTDESSKVRLRTARSGHLKVLTFRMSHDVPSVDLLFALVDEGGTPIDSSSSYTFGTITNTDAVVDAVTSSAVETAHCMHKDEVDGCDRCRVVAENAEEIFAGVLRIIKLWAHNRDVYSQASGYLKGAAWAVVLARIMRDGYRTGHLQIPRVDCRRASVSLPNLSFEAARYFFAEASAWPWPKVVTLDANQDVSVVEGDSAAFQDPVSIAIRRGTMAVLEPFTGANLASTTTQSTTAAMLHELRQAALLLQSCENEVLVDGLVQILKNRPVTEFFEMHQFIICVETFVAGPNEAMTKLPEIKAFGSTRILSFLVDLEHRISPLDLRLRPEPLKLNREWTSAPEFATVGQMANEYVERGFAWFVGVTGDQYESDRLQRMVDESLDETQLLGASGQNFKLRALVLDPSAAAPRLVRKTRSVSPPRTTAPAAAYLSGRGTCGNSRSISGRVLFGRDHRDDSTNSDPLNCILSLDNHETFDSIDSADVIIMRGLPGTGKSSLARHLSGDDGVVINADSYFDALGIDFNPNLLSAAHAHCKGLYEHALKHCWVRKRGGGSRIVVDNTNSEEWEYRDYIDWAAKGWGMSVCILELAVRDREEAVRFGSRSVHSVPISACLAMYDRWEDDKRALLLHPAAHVIAG